MSEPTPDTEPTQADEPQRTTLYAPDGRKVATSSIGEINRLRMSGYTDTPPTAVEVPGDPGESSTLFNPADHTVDEVLTFIEAHPEQGEAVIAAEALGKNRAGIVGR